MEMDPLNQGNREKNYPGNFASLSMGIITCGVFSKFGANPAVGFLSGMTVTSSWIINKDQFRQVYDNATPRLADNLMPTAKLFLFTLTVSTLIITVLVKLAVFLGRSKQCTFRAIVIGCIASNVIIPIAIKALRIVFEKLDSYQSQNTSSAR